MISSLLPLPALPAYRGQYSVGSAVYEVPVKTLYPDLAAAPVPTIKFRIFYPTARQATPPEGSTWIPAPQALYIDAFLKLGRVGPWLSSLARNASWIIKRLRMPVYEDAAPLNDAPHKVLIYTHGLTCSMNTSSAILGELASRGYICFAIEHRDGSAPITEIQTDTDIEAKYFRNVSFKMRPATFTHRDEQLKIRIFEMQATYKLAELLNSGASITNLNETSLDFKGAFDLRPGAVSWMGYSFGGASLVQLLKTTFYRDSLPDQVSQALLAQPASPSLTAQITPRSPVVLIDPWYMPLRSPATTFLYDRPLPCHTAAASSYSSTIGILSSEMAWTWPQCHNHIPAILSSDPPTVAVESAETYEAVLKQYPTPDKYMAASKKDLARIRTLEQQLKHTQSDVVDVYVLNETTHTTFCDYGVIFQWLSYFLKGQKDATSATDNIVRCAIKAAGRSDDWTTIPLSLAAADHQLRYIGSE